MSQDLARIATTVLGVFLVMAMGAFARYMKWFTSEVDRSMAGFTANVLIPSLFFHRTMSDQQLSLNLNAWSPALYGLVLTSIGFGVSFTVAYLVGRFFDLKSDSSRRTFTLCAGIANYGYIPLPLAEAFYPGCFVTLLIHNVGVDMALWSIGLFVIAGVGIRQSWKRIVFSPPLLSVAIAITIRQLGWSLYVPSPIMQMTEQLGRCSIPMGLVLSGAIIFDFASRFKLSEAWRALLLAFMVRMVLLPILFLCVASNIATSLEIKQVLLLQAAMPAATFPIVMTRLYNESIDTAWTVVVGTSAIGLLTIPIWMVIGAYWLGLS